MNILKKLKAFVFLLILIEIFSPQALATGEFGTIYYNNPILNGTRNSQLNLTLHTGSGTNNATDVWCGNCYFNYINSTYVNTNINLTINNNTQLPIVFTSITSGNSIAKLLVNITDINSVQLYLGTNYTYPNSLGGRNVSTLYDDFQNVAEQWSVIHTGGGSITIDRTTNNRVYANNVADASDNRVVLNKTLTGNFKYDFSVNFVSGSQISIFIVGVSDVNGTLDPGDTYHDNYIVVKLYWGSTNNIYLVSVINATPTDSLALSGISQGTEYYLSLYRNNSKAYLKVYSDSNRNNLLGSTSLNAPSVNMHYVYALDTNGVCCANPFSMYIKNTTITDYIYPEITWATWGEQQQIKPAPPTNLTASTSNFWVNYTVEAGTDDGYLVTDFFNISLNNVWTNSSSNHIESQLSPHAWGNISVCGFNSTFNILGDCISANTQIPNNLPAIYNVSSNLAVAEGQVVFVKILNSTELDGDNVTFGTNRSDLFTDFNNATGEGNWTVPHLSNGSVFVIDFFLTDGYGSNHSVMSAIISSGMNTTQSFSPVNSVVMKNNSNQVFAVNCNFCHTWHTSNMIWLLNGLEVQAENAVSLSNYSYTPNSSGIHNLTINAQIASGSISNSWIVNVLDLKVSNLIAVKVTKKTIAWTWTNPISDYFSCTELYLDGVYQSCGSSTSAYLINLAPGSEHTISLRSKDTSGIFYDWINDTETTAVSTSPPDVNSTYSSSWFSPNKGQNFPIEVNYSSSLVPLKNISIEIKTKDENTHVRTISGSYSYNWTITATIKTINWDGKADNYLIVPDAYYISEVSVEDYDGNIATYTNSSVIGVDNTYPSSIMDMGKSRLYRSYYFKSNYSSPDVLRINLGQYYGDFNTSSYLTSNPITSTPNFTDSTLSNLVIRKVGYISTLTGQATFTVTKDSDGKAWVWVDNNLVYNSNSGLLSSDLILSYGLHEVSIEYAKGTANTPITLITKINGSELVFVSPIADNNLSLFATDFNGSGLEQIKYSINNGASYQTYSAPVNVSEANFVYVCSQDNVSNREPCKAYSPDYKEISIPPPLPTPTPPPYITPTPTYTPIPTPTPTPTGTPPPPPTPTPPPFNESKNGTINNSIPENNSLPPYNNTFPPWNQSWPCYGCYSYIYDYFDKPIYYATGSLYYPIIYKLYVVQYNISFPAVVRVTDSEGDLVDGFGVTQYPYKWELLTTRECYDCLKWQAFGVFSADINKNIITPVDDFTWLTRATAIYAPNSAVSPGQINYNLSDTLQFTVDIVPWNKDFPSYSDSSTQEIPDVQLLLYAPANPYNGDPPKLLHTYNIGTVTTDGGTWVFYYPTDLYVDLIGTYRAILWMPTIGGNIYQTSTEVGYGSIDPALYNSIKLNQFNATTSGYIIVNLGANVTSNATGYITITGINITGNASGYITVSPGATATSGASGYITIVHGG